MKKLALLVTLFASCWAFGQGGTTSSDILPANTGQNLGNPTQQWNLFAQDINVYRFFKLNNPSGLKWMNIQPQFPTNLVTCTRENGQKCYFDVAPGALVTPHHLLGSQHDDTSAYSPPVNGDLIIGGNDSLWHAFAGNITTSPLCFVQQGNGSAVISYSWQACSSATNTIAVQHNGSLIGTQPTENYIDGGGLSYNITQDLINHRINITQIVTAAGTGCSVNPNPGAFVFLDNSNNCITYPDLFGFEDTGTKSAQIHWEPDLNNYVTWIINSPGQYEGTFFTTRGLGMRLDVSDGAAASGTIGPIGQNINFLAGANASASFVNATAQQIVATLNSTTPIAGSSLTGQLIGHSGGGGALYEVGQEISWPAPSTDGWSATQHIHGAACSDGSTNPSCSGVTSYNQWAQLVAQGKSWFGGDIQIQPEAPNLPTPGTPRNGGLMGQVACTSTQRGRIHYVNSGTGVADIPEVCAKTSADAYTWQPLIGVGSSTTWVPAGVWNASTAYAINNVVTYNGSSYLSLVANSGVTPGSDGGTTWFLIAQAGTNGVNGTNGTNGANGAPGAPGYSPNQIISGCGVSYSGTGFTFTVAACTYLVNQVQYSSPQTTVTGTGADPSLDRIDSIVANSCSPLPCAGTVSIIAGTASATPAPPSIDITTQTQLTFYQVAASATTPTSLVITDIYHENAEWTCNGTTHVNCASTSNPRSGTKDIEWTSSVSGNNVTLTIPASNIDISTRNVLNGYFRFKAPLSNATLVAQWFNGTTAKCTPVTLKDGNFGINSSNTSTYQLVSIPTSVFNCAGIPVTRLQILQSGTGTLTGFYVDDVTLQGGLTPPTSNSGLQWCGVWNSTTAFAVNCEVTQSNLTYTALQASTNLSPSANPTTWAVHSFNVPGVTGNFVYNASTGTNTLAAFNTSISGSDVTFPGIIYGTQFISTDTVNNTLLDFITGSGGDSTCTAPTAGHSYLCDKSGALNLSNNGGAYAPLGTTTGSGLKRTCALIFGDESGSVLTTGQIQPQKSQCYADVAMTIYQIIVKVDAGASTVQLGFSHASGGAPSVTNYTAAVLTPATVANITDKVVCANTGGTAITLNGVSVTCSTLATGTWNAGDTLGTYGGAADATTKRMSIFVSATVN